VAVKLRANARDLCNTFEMPPTVTKSKLTALELVYPPISNQEAVWLQRDPEVEAELRASDFYMIAGRQEVKFGEIIANEETHLVTFTVSQGDSIIDHVQIQPNELPAFREKNTESYWMEAGPKMVRFWDGPIGDSSSNVLDWFTTEKLLWERSRGKPGITGLDKFRELTTYDLLYVGIAKKGDSFDRLFAKGHKARTDILANEQQRFPGARVTDEIYLFLYHIDPLVIRTFDFDHEFTDEDLSGEIDRKPIVVDAEKAFVSLLKPDYNVVRFNNYPRSEDGLYDSGYARYVYAIAENIEFNTAHGRFRGGWDVHKQFVSNEADAIFIEGDTVKLLISGVDFPTD